MFLNRIRELFVRIDPYEESVDLVLILVGVVIMVVAAHPSHIHGDGPERFQNTVDLANGHIPPSKYSIVQAVLALPLYALGRLLNNDNIFDYFSIIITLIFIVVMITIFRAPIWRKFILLCLSASMLGVNERHFNAEIVTALSVILGFLLAERNNLFVAAILLGIGGANTPAVMPGIALGVAALAIQRKNAWLLALAAPQFILFFGENLLKGGTLMPLTYLSAEEHGLKTVMPYSGLSGFSYPFFFGLLGIVLSFGKGLIFYTPAIFLPRPILTGAREVGICLLAVTIGLVIVYAKWWAWYGGVFFGPRFFLLTSLTAALVMAAAATSPPRELSTRLLFCLIILPLSCWVSMGGFISTPGEAGICFANGYALEHLCWYAPEFSDLWRPFVFGFPKISVGQRNFAVWTVIVGVWICLPLLLTRVSEPEPKSRLLSPA